jgi:hypothetical protein
MGQWLPDRLFWARDGHADDGEAPDAPSPTAIRAHDAPGTH